MTSSRESTRAMSLSHAILSILHLSPLTGYDLKHMAFDQTVQFFWPADQAQIYRTLDRMTEEGWVQFTVEPGDGRPARKVYSITEAGEAELRRWQASPLDPPTYRDALLIQLFFGQETPNEGLIGLIEARRAYHEARMAAYGAIQGAYFEDAPADREHLLRGLVLDLGTAFEQTLIDWLGRAEKVISQLESPEQDASHKSQH